MKTLLASVLLSLAGLAAQAQDLPVYGELSELKDLRRVYATAELPTSRKNILTELKKYAGLEIVDSPDEADFILSFTSRPGTSVSILSAVIVSSNGKRRIVWQEDERQSGISKPNSVNLTRHFIKALKKVRGEK